MLSRREFLLSASVITFCLPFKAYSKTISYRRIVSAGTPSDLYLLALVPNRILGYASLKGNLLAKYNFSKIAYDHPTLGRVVSKNSAIPLETLSRLNPDLIIDIGSTTDFYEDRANTLSKLLQIPYILLDGSFINTANQIVKLGKLLGVLDRALVLSKIITKWIDAASDFSPNLQDKTFYLGRGADGLETGYQGSLHTETIELLGLQNVASKNSITGLSRISPEQLLRWNPDYIITQNEYFLTQLKNNPIYKELSSVKNNNIIYFKNYPFGWIDSPPSLNRVLGLRRLQSYFDENVSSMIIFDLILFYKEFYHTDLNTSQAKKILENEL